ncbi:BURP domain-containing protein [Euphorbia peplus]|nr:BURP domain-containing protein [Euphorbia peplus]
METVPQYLLVQLALFCLVLRGSCNASLIAQEYWKSHLPNTPMPIALQQLLQIDGGITSNFLRESLLAPERGKRITYGTGYWSEIQAFENKQTFVNKTTVYFLRDNLRPHKKMNIIFTKSSKVESKSKEAKVMKQTLEECEAPGIKGEEKHCATSLESLVDYIVSKLGKRVQTLSNEVEKENKKQLYSIENNGIKMMGDKNHIVCHKERYAYAVYYCHKISDTEVYMVEMRGEDGSKAKAAVVCHLDTSAWNPKHYAFQVLDLKPGGPPICHFLNSDTIVWLPN